MWHISYEKTFMFLLQYQNCCVSVYLSRYQVSVCVSIGVDRCRYISEDLSSNSSSIPYQLCRLKKSLSLLLWNMEKIILVNSQGGCEAQMILNLSMQYSVQLTKYSVSVKCNEQTKYSVNLPGRGFQASYVWLNLLVFITYFNLEILS